MRDSDSRYNVSELKSCHGTLSARICCNFGKKSTNHSDLAEIVAINLDFSIIREMKYQAYPSLTIEFGEDGPNVDPPLGIRGKRDFGNLHC